MSGFLHPVSQEWWDREVVLKGQDHNPDPERNKPQADAEIVDVCHCLSQEQTLCSQGIVLAGGGAEYWKVGRCSWLLKAPVVMKAFLHPKTGIDKSCWRKSILVSCRSPSGNFFF